MKVMRIAFLLGAFVVSIAAAPRAYTLTLDQAVTTALSNNLDLRAAYFEIEKARGRLIQAGLWPNPELDFSTSTDRNFANEGERSTTAGFQQAFPISGRLRFAKQVSRVDVAQAMAEVRNRERLLIGEVQRDFLNVLLLRQQVATNREFLGVNREFVGAFEERLKAAEVSEVDVNLARAEMQRLEIEIAIQESDLAARELALKLRLGMPPDQPVSIDGNLQSLTARFRPENYDTTMVVNRPDLRQTELGIDRANAEVRLARAEAWADWTLGAEYQSERSVLETVPVDNDRLFGFRLSIPLALWNRNQGRVYEQRAAAEQAQGQTDALRLTIRSEIATALSRAFKLREVVRKFSGTVMPALNQTNDLIRRGYAEGLLAPAQVIQAQQQRATLRSAFLSANTNYLEALVELETATASSRFLKKDFLIERTETRKSRASSYQK
jgi:cobalt-zinc-cadmium efflux system outer membrane protein